MKVLVTGSRGLIGSALVDQLCESGHEVMRLVRVPSAADHTIILWNPESEQIIDPRRMDGVDVAIHLAGENVATDRWTTDKKARIRNSRVQGTALLTRTLAALDRRPSVFLCASATGYYGDRGDEFLDEDSSPGGGFLAGVCRDWEGATHAASEAGIRVVHLRFGLILSMEGGALPKMAGPFRMGIGGRVGTGRQYWSWITLRDAIRAIEHVMTHDEATGPVNIVSPTPSTNEEFTQALAHAVSRPALLPLPAFAARMILGREAADTLLLSSARVLPTRLKKAGFIFEQDNLEEALRSILYARG